MTLYILVRSILRLKHFGKSLYFYTGFRGGVINKRYQENVDVLHPSRGFPGVNGHGEVSGFP